MSELCELESHLNCSLKTRVRFIFPLGKLILLGPGATVHLCICFHKVRKRQGSALLVDKQQRSKCTVERGHLLSWIMIDGVLSDWFLFSFLSVQPINLKIGGEQILSEDAVDFLYGPRTMLAKKTESLHWSQIK